MSLWITHLVLQPGHDVDTPGKRAEHPGLGVVREYATTRRVCEAVIRHLQASGSTVRVYDPHDEVEVRAGHTYGERGRAAGVEALSDRQRLSRRIRWANRLRRDLGRPPGYVWLGVHTNAAGPTARGYVAFDSVGATDGDRLSLAVLRGLSGNRCGLPAFNRPRIERDYAEVRDTHCPAALVELGFHSSRSDARIHLDPDAQDELGRAIVEGLRPHLSWAPPSPEPGL